MVARVWSLGLQGLLLAALLPSSVFGATTYHVSPQGNDAHPGTAEQPLATVQRALDLLAFREGPHEIVLRAGVYRGDVVIGGDENPPPLLLRAAVRADGLPEDVIFDGARPLPGAEPLDNAPGTWRLPVETNTRMTYSVWEEDTRIRYTPVADTQAVVRTPASYHLTGAVLHFRTSDDRPPEAHTVAMARDNYGLVVKRPNVTLRGLQFRHFMLQRSSAGVRVEKSNVLIEHCRVWNARRGFTISTDVENAAIRRCRVDDVGNGVFSYGVNTVVEDSVLFRIPGRFEVQEYSQDQSGFQCYSPALGGAARRNLVVGFDLGLFFKCPPSRFVAEYNTVVGTGKSAFGIGCTHWFPESVFRHNIVAGYATALLTGFTGVVKGAVVDDNCLWQPEGGDKALRKLVEEGIGARNINADPLFADAANHDFRLRKGSPAAAMGAAAKPIGALPLADAAPLRLPPAVAGALDRKAPAPAADEPAAIAPTFIPRSGPPRAWHVDPLRGRDDAARGDEQQPLKSLQVALNHANPGDRVVLLPGIYFGPHVLNHGGTRTAPIVIEASPAGEAVLDGKKLYDEANLTLDNAPNVILKGLEIRWFKETGLFVRNSPDVQVLECLFWNNDWSTGRRIGAAVSVQDSRGLTLDRCVLYALDRGITLVRSPAFRITRNTMTMCLHRGLWLIDSVAGSVLRNNSVTFTGNENISVRASPEELAAFDSDYNNFAAHVRQISERRPPPEEDLKPEPGDFFFGKEAKGVAELNSERLFSLREWQEKTGKDTHSIFKHPRYADPRQRDFRLRPDSPNLGAGENGTTIGALGPANR